MGDIMAEKQISKSIRAIVLVVATILAVYLFMKATVGVELSDSSINVKGLYGTEIPYADIVSVQELDRLPPAGTRTNGIGLGFMNIGYFSYPDIGKVTLYQMSGEKPYILVRTRDRQVIYGFGREKNAEIMERIGQIPAAGK